MNRAFLNLTAAEVTVRVEAAAATVAGGAVAVRVGEEDRGYRNVGVTLPRGRRSAAEGRRLRGRVWAALEAAGVVMAPTAGAPKVEGDLLGHVRVREVAANWADASGLARPPRRPRSGRDPM